MTAADGVEAIYVYVKDDKKAVHFVLNSFPEMEYLMYAHLKMFYENFSKLYMLIRIMKQFLLYV